MNEATTTGAPKRPTFLTVLCILSFIGGAWGVIGGIINMAAGNDSAAVAEMSAEMDQAQAELGDDAASQIAGDMMNAAGDFAVKAAENAKSIGIANIVLSLLSLAGVWMMWNLKKTGFYVYTVATICGLAVPLIFLGVNLMSMLSVGIGGLFGVLFIILYGVNLKHMS